MALSQRSTQIKCADSDISILSSREVPRRCACRHLFSGRVSSGVAGRLRVPHPSIKPRDIVGQSLCLLVHARSARCHMVLDSMLSHSVKMWSSDSVSVPHE